MFMLFLRMAKGAALAALFSAHVHAQELITKGNSAAPHQPPAWFVRMAKPEAVFPPELDGFIVARPDERSDSPRRNKSGIKYACKPTLNEKGVLTWQFCEM